MWKMEAGEKKWELKRERKREWDICLLYSSNKWVMNIWKFWGGRNSGVEGCYFWHGSFRAKGCPWNLDEPCWERSKSMSCRLEARVTSWIIVASRSKQPFLSSPFFYAVKKKATMSMTHERPPLIMVKFWWFLITILETIFSINNFDNYNLWFFFFNFLLDLIRCTFAM